MGMKYIVRLTADERAYLHDLIHNGRMADESSGFDLAIHQ
jgi:hypothetical protein